MDFRLDPDERVIVEQAGRTIAKHLAPLRVAKGDPVRTAWQSIGAEGWLHTGLPGSVGGGDLSLAMVAALGREAGRVMAGDAFVDNAVVLPRLIESPTEEYLETLVANPGFVIGIGARSTRAHGVEPGLSAYLIDDGQLFRHAQDEWKFAPAGAFGVMTGEVSVSGDPVSIGRVTADLDSVIRDAAIVHAATLIGLGEVAVSDTIEYVKTREQFGRPIGGFQAVKHILAEAQVALEVAWNAAMYAALLPSSETVAIASMQASGAADLAARAMVQLHGGIAMTWEHHAHWYIKVIETSRLRFGSPTHRALELEAMLRKERQR